MARIPHFEEKDRFFVHGTYYWSELYRLFWKKKNNFDQKTHYILSINIRLLILTNQTKGFKRLGIFNILSFNAISNDDYKCTH